MLKAIVNYAKKIPVPGSDYSSQGYSLSLETEIAETDPTAIRARLHETFQTVRDQVEFEIAGVNGNGQQPPAVTSPAPTPVATPPQRAGGNGDKASNRQIKYLTDLATQKGIGLSALNAEVQQRFGVSGIYDLGRREASALLDEIKDRRKAA